MIIVWLLTTAIGLTVAVWGSKRAVTSAAAIALGFGVSPFVVGVVVLSVGTDLPEVANSIVASVNGNGDINLGDSIGSAVTQTTLILGLLPFIVGSFSIGARRVRAVGLLTVAALAVTGFLTFDGWLSRADGFTLVGLWVLMSIFVARRRLVADEPTIAVHANRSWRLVAVAAGALVVVTAGALAAVLSLIEIAELLSAPEFLVSFFGLAVGTSLPELVVVVTALRQGQKDLAIGDVFGASLVDSSLSVGAGPVVAPVAVTASYALWSTGAAALAILIVTLVVAQRRRHTRWTGILFLAFYASLYPILLNA